MAKPGPKPGTVNNPKGINQYSSGPKARPAIATKPRQDFFLNHLKAEKDKMINGSGVHPLVREIGKAGLDKMAVTRKGDSEYNKLITLQREMGKAKALRENNPAKMSFDGLTPDTLWKGSKTVMEAFAEAPIKPGPYTRPRSKNIRNDRDTRLKKELDRSDAAQHARLYGEKPWVTAAKERGSRGPQYRPGPAKKKTTSALFKTIVSDTVDANTTFNPDTKRLRLTVSPKKPKK